MPSTEMDTAARQAVREHLADILQAKRDHWLSELLLDPGTGKLWPAGGPEDRVFSLPTVDAGHMHAGKGDQAQFSVEFSLQNRTSYVAENTLAYYSREAVWVAVGDDRVPIMKTDLEALERLEIVPAGTVAAAPPAAGWGPEKLLKPDRYRELQAKLAGKQAERYLDLQKLVNDPKLGSPPDQACVDEAIAASQAADTPEARTALALANRAAEDATAAAGTGAVEAELVNARSMARAGGGGFVSVGGLLFGLVIIGSAVYVYRTAEHKVTALTGFAAETVAGLAEVGVAEAIVGRLGWPGGLGALALMLLEMRSDSSTSEVQQRIDRTEEFLYSVGFNPDDYSEAEYQLLRDQAYELLFRTTPLVIAPSGATVPADDVTSAYVDERGLIHPSDGMRPAGPAYTDPHGLIHGSNFNLAIPLHDEHANLSNSTAFLPYDSSQPPHDEGVTPVPAHHPADPHANSMSTENDAADTLSHGYGHPPVPYDSTGLLHRDGSAPSVPDPANQPALGDGATPSWHQDSTAPPPHDVDKSVHHDNLMPMPSPGSEKPSHDSSSAPVVPHVEGRAADTGLMAPAHHHPSQPHHSSTPHHHGAEAAANNAPKPDDNSAVILPPRLVPASPEVAKHYTVEGHSPHEGAQTNWLILKDGAWLGRVTEARHQPELQLWQVGDRIQVQVIVPGGGILEAGSTAVDWGIWNPGPASPNGEMLGAGTPPAPDGNAAGKTVTPTVYTTGPETGSTHPATENAPALPYNPSQPDHEGNAAPPQTSNDAPHSGAQRMPYDPSQLIQSATAPTAANEPVQTDTTPPPHDFNQPTLDGGPPVAQQDPGQLGYDNASAGTGATQASDQLGQDYASVGSGIPQASDQSAHDDGGGASSVAVSTGSDTGTGDS